MRSRNTIKAMTHKWWALTMFTALLLSLIPAGRPAQASNTRQPLAPKQLIFMADGMRPDLVETWAKAGDLPNYAKIVNNGVTGENGMTPQVAGNTGAGWTTVSTGAWPGTHGQVNNTYHINSNGILTSTSGFDGSRNQAETYAQALERQGKKVAVVEWAGTLPTTIKGPAIDFRAFYSNRGVATNYVIPNTRPDPSVNYTNTLQLADASGWSNVPASNEPAKETSFSFNTNTISGTVATINYNVYIYDSTNDSTQNYDHAVVVQDGKDGSKAAGDLMQGDWASVKLALPQNGVLTGFYIKLIDLAGDLSKVRIYYTSLSRVRANLPDLEQKIAADFPAAVGADFAPLQAGYVDADTYVEQGLKWYDTYKEIYNYVIATYTPDVMMAGVSLTDEFSHQFMALATPGYTGPRLIDISQQDAEAVIKSAYKLADTALGDLWAAMGGENNVTTFVGSDHGFAPIWRSVNVNQVLQDAGLYDPANRGQSKAVVYISGGTANIYVNLAGREVAGVVTTTDLLPVRQQIVDAFKDLNDNGTSVIGAVMTKEETRTIKANDATINGWFPTRTGDVVVILKPPYQFDAPTAGQRVADAPFYGQHGFLPDTVDLANNINMHAMFGAYGPGIAQGKKVAGVRSIDLVPTAAYAMNLLPPRYAEGQVVGGVFADNTSSLVPIQVLNWSDYHGQLDPVSATFDAVSVNSGGVALIGSYWKEAMAQNPNGTIIVSDGDNIGATPPNSAFLNDDPIINAMNMLGFTASAMGNHEFDKGVAGFRRIKSLAQFSYLANNILDSSTGKLADFATPYIIVKANGIDVGIIGAANPETPQSTSPAGIAGYQWIDPIAPTNQYVQELVGKGIKTIIVLYHQGSESGGFDDVNGIFGDFARGVDPEVDLIVGGHTRVKTMARVNNTLVTAANNAMDTGRVTLMVDPATNNVVYSWGSFQRPLAGAITPDAGLADLVKQASDAIKPVLGEEVGTAAALIDRSRGAESKMGNLVSDAIRATYQVDVALQNSGGLRADFTPGSVTKGNVFAVLPFGNLVVTGKIKGSDLLAALENGVSNVTGTAGRFIQLSGVRFAYDAAKPVGSRVLWAVFSDGRSLDPNATYTVATNDFMQVGGDGYTSLTKITDPISREQLWEVAANYVKSLGTVDPQIEGRIIAAVEGQPAPVPPAAVTPILPTPASILPTLAPVQPQPTSTSTSGGPQVQPTPGGSIPGMPTTGSGPDTGWAWLLVTLALIVMLTGAAMLRRKALR